MVDSQQGSSVAERSRRIRQSLLDLLDSSRKPETWVEPQKIEDMLDRFRLWTGNLGALHEAHKQMSLESRLADSPEVKDQICEQLDDMQEAVQDLLALSSGRSFEIETNTEDTEDTTNTEVPENDLVQEVEYTRRALEADSILCMVSECLRALFRIGVLVRRATPRDRFERALQQSEYAFAAQFDINYVEERYPKLASEGSRWLASRLGGANSKRRQFIHYVQDHRAKLQVDDSNTAMHAPTVRQSSKATTFVTPVNLSTSEFLESSLDDDDDSASLISASTAFDTETSLRLPSLADLGPDGEYFECPICFTLQSFRREKAWKLHAYRDLKAYVCTSTGEDCEHKMFSDRDTWFDHELKQHHSLYVCKLCGVQHNTVEVLKQHFIDKHGIHSEEETTSVIEHGKLVPSQLKAQDCPFCDEWASILSRRRHQTDGRAPPGIEQGDILVSLTHFKRHVATHQEQLAIFAMPRTIDGDDDRSHGAGSPNSEAFSSNDGSSQGPDDHELDHILRAIDDEFKITVKAMCRELLVNPPSNSLMWTYQYNGIMATVSDEIKAKGEACKTGHAPGVSEGGTNRIKAQGVLLNIYPEFATLMAKYYKSRAHDDNDLEDIHFLGTNGGRCKLYKLVNNDWEDQGTGFCKASVQSTETGQRNILITVKSETEPGPLIMDEAVPVDFGQFQKQQATLIVWRDPSTRIDMALSFQGADGCDAIWEVIDGVQRDVDNEPSTAGAEGEVLPSMQDAMTAEGLEASEFIQGLHIKVHHPHKEAVQEVLDSALGKDSWCWAEVRAPRKAQFILQYFNQNVQKLPDENERIIKLKRTLSKNEMKAVQDIVLLRHMNYSGSKNVEVPDTGDENYPRSQDATGSGPERMTELGFEKPAGSFPETVIREEQDGQPALRRDATQSIEVENSHLGLQSSSPSSQIGNARSNDMAQKCVHQGCGKTYTDAEEVCRYHPGPPIFHKGQKGWKCCKSRVLTFEEFMKIEPCTRGKHSTTDIPPPIENKEADPVLAEVERRLRELEIRRVAAERAEQRRREAEPAEAARWEREFLARVQEVARLEANRRDDAQQSDSTTQKEVVDNKEGREQDAVAKANDTASSDTVTPKLETSLPLAVDAADGEEEELELEDVFSDQELKTTGDTRLQGAQDAQTQPISEVTAKSARGEPTPNSANASARTEAVNAMIAEFEALDKEGKAASAASRALHENIQAELVDIQKEVRDARPSSLGDGEGSQVHQRYTSVPPGTIMALRIDNLVKGDVIIPPCDRCRRLRVQCVKQLTDCQGCTQKNTKCGWKTISDEELKMLWQRFDPGAS